jgi:hypothetical protein
MSVGQYAFCRLLSDQKGAERSDRKRLCTLVRIKLDDLTTGAVAHVAHDDVGRTERDFEV